jgi:hypothetical protein
MEMEGDVGFLGRPFDLERRGKGRMMEGKRWDEPSCAMKMRQEGENI